MKTIATVIYNCVMLLIAVMVVVFVVAVVCAICMAFVKQTELSILVLFVVGLFQWACKRKDLP